MSRVFGSSEAVAREIQGQFRAGTDKIVSRKFGAVARVIWPFKTAANIAAIGGLSERHAARIIAGEFEPTGAIIAAVILEITRLE